MANVISKGGAGRGGITPPPIRNKLANPIWIRVIEDTIKAKHFEFYIIIMSNEIRRDESL